MGALDPAKILMILVIALIVLGPEKLPRVARQLGAGWRELVKFRERMEAEVREALPDVDLPRIPTSPRAAVAGFLSDLTTPLSEPLAADGAGSDEEGSAPAPADGTASPAGTAPAPPVPAMGANAAPAAKGRPLALEHPLVAPDDPSMN